jgi:hypothetical protein
LSGATVNVTAGSGLYRYTVVGLGLVTQLCSPDSRSVGSPPSPTPDLVTGEPLITNLDALLNFSHADAVGLRPRGPM